MIHIAILFAVILPAAMLLLMEAGRRLGRRQLEKDAEGARAGMGAVEGAVFALLGLIIAFTFSGAASKFDARKQLVIEEANALGTAWLRLDVLPDEAQPKVRQLFREYLDTRIETYAALPDIAAAKSSLARSAALQQQIWSECVRGSSASGPPQAGMLLLPALNQMFDIASSRAAAALHLHPHPIIFVLLGFMALASSLMAGFGMAGAKRRSWFHMVAFSLILAVSVYVILDLEYPRLGVIRVDSVDQLLIDLRKTMD